MKIEITKLFSRLFPAYTPVPAGLYRGNLDLLSRPNKAHLRIDRNGTGILILDGSIVLHLNQTATEFAYYLIQKLPVGMIEEKISKRYGITKKDVSFDLTKFLNQIENLLSVPDIDPVAYLDINRIDINSGAISAPYRLDCALTYRHPDNGYLRFAPVERVKTELGTEEWKTILKKAWDAGIPHVVFTGGEPLLREDCPELIRYASDLGMVTGLLTSGFSLSGDKIKTLIEQCGLDHIMLIYQEDGEWVWDVIDLLISKDLSVTVHITLVQKNRIYYLDLLEHLYQRGIRNLSLSTNSLELKEEVDWARDIIAEKGFRLIWDLPVPYSHLHPVALEITLSEESHKYQKGYSSLYAEPDGDILSAQGDFQVLGNLLRDSWETIWNAAVAKTNLES